MAYLDDRTQKAEAAALAKQEEEEKRKAKSILTVTRTIEFYKVRQEAEGGNIDKYSPEELYKQLTAIPTKQRNVRIKTHNNDEILQCWPHKGKSLHCAAIGITRTKARNGILTADMDLVGYELADGHEACEYSHIVMFTQGIVGLEYNPHGPRLSQFSDFLFEKCPRLGRLRFDALCHKNFKERLAKRLSFSKMRFKVTRDNFDLYTEALGDYASLKKKQLNDGAPFDIIEVEFKTRQRDKSRFTGFAQDVGKYFLKQKDPQAALDSVGAKFYGKNDEVESRALMNLLQDKIVASRSIDLESLKDKRTKSESAFQAIRSAYDDNEKYLMKSVAIEI